MKLVAQEGQGPGGPTTRSSRAMRRVLGLLLGAALALATSAAAAPADDTRLDARLSPSAAAAVREILDQASAQSLPTAPLVATALEGAARGAPSERIVAAVRALATSLRAARQSLDARSAEAEIVAGASVIRAGVPADSLARLRGARSGSLVVPLVVMADMVARGVPPGTASGTVIAGARRGVRDADLLRLREHVAHDIRAGASPQEAALVRTQAFLMSGADRARRPAERSRLPGRAAP